MRRFGYWNEIGRGRDGYDAVYVARAHSLEQMSLYVAVWWNCDRDRARRGGLAARWRLLEQVVEERDLEFHRPVVGRVCLRFVGRVRVEQAFEPRG